MAERDHRGVHARGDRAAVGRALADGEQLDGAAHLLGGGEVGGGDLGHALAVDVVQAHAGVEGDPGEDGGLGSGVEALDVGGRVGLGVPERGGLVEGLLVAGARGVHLVEDEVGGAVDDAEDPVDLVAGEGLAQRPDQRDGTGDGGLVVEVPAVLGGGGVQRGAVLGEERLVGRDDGGAVLEGGGDEGAGGLDPPDDLHHDVDVAAFDEGGGVGGDQGGVDALADLGGPAYGHSGEFEGGADPGGEVLRVRRHDARHL